MTTHEQNTLKEIRIFYCWQSDLPNNVTRGLIESALEKAVKNVNNDKKLGVILIIDQDTRQVSGAKEITRILLEKIERSHIFVCDASIIHGEIEGKRTPNPNVMYELGYALGKLGEDFVIIAMNTAYGNPELLPFDIRARTLASFRCPELSQVQIVEEQNKWQLEKGKIRDSLAGKFEMDIKNMISILQVKQQPQTQLRATAHEQIIAPSIHEQVITAIKSSAIDKIPLVEEYMDSIIKELKDLIPQFPRDSRCPADFDDKIVEAIESTAKLVSNFSAVARISSLSKDLELSTTFLRGFCKLAENYEMYSPDSSTTGLRVSYRCHESDLYKFLGHELFTILVAFLMKDKNWEFLSNLLNESIIFQDFGTVGNLKYFTVINKRTDSLDEIRNSKRTDKQISIRAYMLKERHEKGVLIKPLTFDMIKSADYLLYMKSMLDDKLNSDFPQPWIPWSSIYLTQHPSFLVEAQKKGFAQQLANLLGFNSVEDLKGRLTKPELNVFRVGLYRNGYGIDEMKNYNPTNIGIFG